MSDEHNADIDYTGDEAEGRLILCSRCCQYQPLCRDGHPECTHTISDAKDISDLDGLDWAYVRLRAYRSELHRDGGSRGQKHVLQSNIASLVWDLISAGEEVPDPDEIDSVLAERLDYFGGDGR